MPGTMTRSDLATLKIGSNIGGSLSSGQGEAGVASMGERLAAATKHGGKTQRLHVGETAAAAAWIMINWLISRV